MNQLMDRDEIYRRLNLLNNNLKEKEIKGELTIYGGAVMCLFFNSRRATKDIDGWFAPKSDISEAIKEVTKENNFDEDWLNDAVKGFISKNDDVKLEIEFSNLKIYRPKDEYLFAMKCMSCRIGFGENDERDIRFLIEKMGITSTEEAEEIIQDYFPPSLILPKTHFMLLEFIGK